MNQMGMLDDRWETITFGIVCAVALIKWKENETQVIYGHRQLLAQQTNPEPAAHLQEFPSYGV
jgi:hypothetical protein